MNVTISDKGNVNTRRVSERQVRERRKGKLGAVRQERHDRHQEAQLVAEQTATPVSWRKRVLWHTCKEIEKDYSLSKTN